MPVLVLTARDSWSDKVAGLDAGADDYLAKPFQTEELIARLRALIRRSSGNASSELIAGDIRLDTRSGKVTKSGEPVKLTAQEYKLLSYLMHHKGKVVSRTELIEHIYDQDFDRDSNTIEVFVTRIRKKLGADVITTIRGLGYAWRNRTVERSKAAAAHGGGRAQRRSAGDAASGETGSLTPSNDRRRGAVDHRAAADRRLCARSRAVAVDRRQLRQPACLRPQLDDRLVRDRARRRGPLQPTACRSTLRRTLFGPLLPDQRRARDTFAIALVVGPAPAGL